MDWKTSQGYEEKYAKITVKPHKTFDGKVIEVLYGALDENGQPLLEPSGGFLQVSGAKVYRGA